MDLKNKILQNSGIGILGGGIVAVLAAVKIVLLGRYLSLDDFGLFIICLNLLAIFRLAFRIGFEPTLLRFFPEFSKGDNAAQKQQQLLMLCIIIALCATMLVISLFAFGSRFVANHWYHINSLSNLILLIGLSGSGYFLCEICTAMLRLANKFHLALIPGVLGGLITVGWISYANLASNVSLEQAVYAAAAGEFCVFAGLVLLAFPELQKALSAKENKCGFKAIAAHKNEIRQTLFQTSLLNFLRSGSESGGVFLLGLLGTTGQVALLGMAIQLARPLTIIQSAVGSAVNPEVSKLYFQKRINEVVKFLKVYLLYSSVVTGFVMLALSLILPWGIKMFIGEHYLEALPLFLILLFSYGLVIVFQPFLAVAIARTEVKRRNFLISLRFLYLGIAACYGITAFMVVVIVLVGNISIRVFNDLPLFINLKRLANKESTA